MRQLRGEGRSGETPVGDAAAGNFGSEFDGIASDFADRISRARMSLRGNDLAHVLRSLHTERTVALRYALQRQQAAQKAKAERPACVATIDAPRMKAGD